MTPEKDQECSWEVIHIVCDMNKVYAERWLLCSNSTICYVYKMIENASLYSIPLW
jgi:hypothetical protein